MLERLHYSTLKLFRDDDMTGDGDTTSDINKRRFLYLNRRKSCFEEYLNAIAMPRFQRNWGYISEQETLSVLVIYVMHVYR